MNFLIVAAGAVFTLLSTVILSYISIATMVGPWIAPTLVLFGHILFSFIRSDKERLTAVTLAQAIGAGGGIVATGIGFSLPMLYFMDKPTFSALLANPVHFCLTLGALTLVAGGFGLLMGHAFARPFITQQQQPFPVSALTHNIITSGSSMQQARVLASGIGLTAIVCAVRDGFWLIPKLINKNYYVWGSLLGDALTITIWPTLWAIGFTVGLGITLPLFYGMLCKYVVMYPLIHHAQLTGFSLFNVHSAEAATVAFCSGLVASDLIFSLPGLFKNFLSLKWVGVAQGALSSLRSRLAHYPKSRPNRHNLFLGLSWLGALFSSALLLWHFAFSPLMQACTLAFTALATYSICEIGGRIGMIPFGRYSTFIVVPLLLMFSLSPLQATIVCVFFNIAAAAASDTLFDYKTAELAGINKKQIMIGQVIGLVITALAIGGILWLLFTHLELGSEALFGQRGKAKALLLQTLHFEKILVLFGILFGRMLKSLKVNSAMVFGGLIMPNSVTLGLLAGSLMTLVPKNRNYYQPFCAGALAAESLWVLILIIFGVFGIK